MESTLDYGLVSVILFCWRNDMAASATWGPFLGVTIMRALLIGVCIVAPDC